MREPPENFSLPNVFKLRPHDESEQKAGFFGSGRPSLLPADYTVPMESSFRPGSTKKTTSVVKGPEASPVEGAQSGTKRRRSDVKKGKSVKSKGPSALEQTHEDDESSKGSSDDDIFAESSSRRNPSKESKRQRVGSRKPTQKSQPSNPPTRRSLGRAAKMNLKPMLEDGGQADLDFGDD